MNACQYVLCLRSKQEQTELVSVGNRNNHREKKQNLTSVNLQTMSVEGKI